MILADPCKSHSEAPLSNGENARPQIDRNIDGPSPTYASDKEMSVVRRSRGRTVVNSDCVIGDLTGKCQFVRVMHRG
jgi:hypothetical protein